MTDIFEAIAIARDWPHEKPAWAGSSIQTPPDLAAITQRCIDVYLLSQGPRGGIGGIGWWQWANGYTAIALHDKWSSTKNNYQRLTDALRRCEGQHGGFVNEFNDDTLWWAICCLQVYDIGGDRWFLDKVRTVWHYFNDKKSVCGRGQLNCCGHDMEGGCFWTTKPGECYLNAITTGLYAELSVRLALIKAAGTSDRHSHYSKLSNLLSNHRQPEAEDYIKAARCSLGWIFRCVYRSRDAVIVDGIRTKANELVNWTFTYNTGVAIGVCALLFEATRDGDHMTLACYMAQHAMRNRGWVEENGVLTDRGAWGKAPGEPAKNGDGVGFKGVLMRHLGTLYDVIRRTGAQSTQARGTADLIKTFVDINLDSQQQRNTNGRGQYGPWWNGPYECATSHSQLPVLDVMAAAMLVNAT